MKLNEAILSEKKSAAAEFKKRRSAVDKELKEIEKKLKGMDTSQKKDPENWGYVASASAVLKKLKELENLVLVGASNEAAYDQANRGSTGEDPSGEGEARNQRGTRDHARGTAPEDEKWLKANPRNEW